MKLKFRAIVLVLFYSLLFSTLAKSQYCSGITTLTSGSGSFTDGSGTYNYADNSDCEWLIQPPGATSITLTFSSFITEFGFDYVTVYDGPTTSSPVLGSFSGSSIPSSVTSSGGSMLVNFTSDGSVNYAGWSASYYSNFCSGTTYLTSSSGSFSDGSGSNDYGIYSDCYWLIQPPGATSITLSFSSFITEANFDFVTIYDGSTTSSPVLGSFSGFSIPDSVTSSGGSMLVHFTSDFSVTYAGWSASYTSISPPPAPVANPATNIILTGFTANWSTSDGATGYQLDIATDAGFTSFVTGYNNKNVYNVTSSSITGLSANTYYYRVRAYNSNGTSQNSNSRLTAIGTTCSSLNYLAIKALSVPGSYIDLGTNGTVITTSSFDDANSGAQNIGFTFSFNCQSFTQFVLNTNGFIKLGNTPPSSPALYFDGAQTAGGGIFNSTDPADVYLISAFNHDLTGTGTSEYRVYTSGTAPNRVCTIQYKNITEYTTIPPQQYSNIQFQIKLYETSNIIEFVYGDWTPSANASAYKTSACGLKGMGSADNQLLVVNKSSVTTWDAVGFTNANYSGNATLNFGNPPDRPKPDAGRTFRFIPAYNNDLTVGEIYSLGDASLYYSNPQSTSVNIINSGLNNEVNIPVTLTISGANSFTDTQYISSLNSGQNAIVTFAGFNATSNGSTSVVVSLPNDDYNGDNTKTWTQNTNNYTCDYSSTAIPTNAWGGVNDSIWSVKYHVTGSANVNSVNVYIANNAASVGQTVFGVVLNGSGIIVAQSANYVIQASDLSSWHTFTFAVPPAMTDAAFYAGFGNNTGSSSYFALGIQTENPSRPNTYFQSAIDGTGLTSINSGFRFMIGATLAPFAPIAGTASSNSPICNGSSATLTLTGYAGSIHWQQSADGSTGWTYVSAGTGVYSANYITGNLSSAIYFRAEVTQPGFSTVYSNVIAITLLAAPTTPITGIITQPTCSIPTGSVVLSGLPASGTWIITATPGGASTPGTGTNTTITGLVSGTYTFTVTNSTGCTSAASSNVVINVQTLSPSAPAIGTITQPTCTTPTGSVILNGLPATGSWVLTKSPGGTTTTGTGTSSTISGLVAGTYNYSVTNASGCTSVYSANIIINTQPSTPSSPIPGTITQPTCAVSTGSVDLSGLPAVGTWTVTRTPGGTTTTGTGTGSTISGLPSGTYTFTVTNASGCTSIASDNIVVSSQPPTPSAPVVGTLTQPTCISATGSVILTGLPGNGSWTLTRTPGGITSTITGTSVTISGLQAGTYTYTVDSTGKCMSPASSNIVINAQPSTPTAPTVGTISQPTCSVATGSVALSGLPATGTWTITVTPGGTTANGTGTSSTLSGLAAGTYTCTVTNAPGCISVASDNIVINTQPITPMAPTIGTITQPTCPVPSGSVVLNSLPAGTWTLTMIHGGTTTTGTGTSSTITGLEAGTYNYAVTNASGCTSAESADVDILLPQTGVIPKIKAKWGDVLICLNLGDSLTTYQWFNGSNAISGATRQFYVTNKHTGIYKVVTTDKNGCKNSSKTISIPISGSKSISIYPNPASVSFAIKLDDESEGRAIVSLLNSAGIKVMEFQVENTDDELLKDIPVSNLNDGIYLVQVSINENLYYAKIVVRR